MIRWVVDNLSLSADDTLVVIYNPAWMSMKNFMEEQLADRDSRVRLVELPGPTRGAAETVLIGLKSLPEDMLKRPTLLAEPWRHEAFAKTHNAVFCFKDTQPKPIYSYIKLDIADNIKEVKEKIKISDWANTGCYCFRDGAELAQECEALIRRGETQLSQDQKGEFYTSGVIAAMIARGAPFRGIKLDREDFHVLGTPTQVAEWCAKWPNQPKMRFVFDLYGTLAARGQQGHHVAVWTERPAEEGAATLDLLQSLGVEYHELHFGKVVGDFYIDDRGVDPILGDLEKQSLGGDWFLPDGGQSPRGSRQPRSGAAADGRCSGSTEAIQGEYDWLCCRAFAGTSCRIFLEKSFLMPPSPPLFQRMGFGKFGQLEEKPRLFSSFLALASHLLAYAPHGAAGRSQAYGPFQAARGEMPRGPMSEMLSHETPAGLALVAQLTAALRSAVSSLRAPVPRAAEMLAAAGLMLAGAEAHEGVLSSSHSALSEVILHTLSLLLQLVPPLGKPPSGAAKGSLQAMPLLSTLLEVLGQLLELLINAEEVRDRQRQRQVARPMESLPMEENKKQKTGAAPGWPARASTAAPGPTDGSVQVLRTPEEAQLREASETQAEELDQILHSGFSSLVRSSAVPRPVQRPLHPFFPKDAERLLFSGCDGAMEKYGQMPAVLVHNDVSQMFKDPEMPRGGSRVFADENPAAVW
eukprot:g11100.t1